MPQIRKNSRTKRASRKGRSRKMSRTKSRKPTSKNTTRASKNSHKLSKHSKGKKGDSKKIIKQEAPKLSAKEKKVLEYKKKHRLLKLSDFTNLQPGQPVVITFIHEEEKIKTFTFKFNRIEPTKGKLRKWYTHSIYGSSGYTQGLPLGVKKSTGEIRYAESSDSSPAYLDKPIVIQKLKPIKLRPSPTESATLFKVGTKKVGNDKNTWIIVETATGTKRWKLVK